MIASAGGIEALDFHALAAGAGDDEADDFVALLDHFDVGAGGSRRVAVVTGRFGAPGSAERVVRAELGRRRAQRRDIEILFSLEEGFHGADFLGGLTLGEAARNSRGSGACASAAAGFAVVGAAALLSDFSLAGGSVAFLALSARLSVTR